MIKAMIRKELRETLVFGVVGLLIFTAEMLMSVHGYNVQLALALHNHSNSQYGVQQPMEATTFYVLTGITCVLLGVALGGMQARSERHRDLLAFLMHRPIGRGKLFSTKVAVGLGVYAAASLLPLGMYLVWSATPGNVAAPFQPNMAEPFVSGWFAGVAGYFAAFIVQWRNARWYGSRFLVALACLLVLVTSMCPAWPYGVTILVTLVEIAMMALAACGTFVNLGEDEGMPKPARAALATILIPGTLVLFVYAAIVAADLLQIETSPPNKAYLVTKDGAIYRFEMLDQQIREIEEVGEKTAALPDAPEKIFARLSTNQATGFYLRVDPLHRRPKDDFPPRADIQFLIRDNQAWFYWGTYGRFVEYDLLTRRISGSLGPAGMATNLLGKGDHFGSGTTEYGWPGGFSTFHDRNTLYRMDFRTFRATPFFHTEAGDEIVTKQDAFAQITYPGQIIPPVMVSNVLVQTVRALHLVDCQENELWKLPFGAQGKDVREYQLYTLGTRGEYLLWAFPPRVTGAQFGQGQPIHVMRISGGQVTKEFDLPARGDTDTMLGELDGWFAGFLPAPLWTALAWLQDRTWTWTIPWTRTCWSLVVAGVLWWPAGLFLGRRYRLRAGSQLAWAIFNLLFNLPGFLVFLSLNEWTAREACPACKKPRVVNHDHCEHCGAEFAPAPKTGIEIFEPIAGE